MTPALRRAVEALERIGAGEFCTDGCQSFPDGFCKHQHCADEALAAIRAMPEAPVETLADDAELRGVATAAIAGARKNDGMRLASETLATVALAAVDKRRRERAGR